MINGDLVACVDNERQYQRSLLGKRHKMKKEVHTETLLGDRNASKEALKCEASARETISRS